MPAVYKHASTLRCKSVGDRCMTVGGNNSRPQVGEDHLKEEDAHAVHVKLVWVVQAPQDGGQEGSHRQWRRSRSLYTHTQQW